MLRQFLVVLLALAASTPLLASDRVAPQSVLDDAIRQTGLLENPAHAFVLDADFTAQFSQPVQGHVELRWAAKDRWWSRVIVGDFEQVKFKTGEWTYTTRNAPYTPPQVNDLLNLLDPPKGYEKLIARKMKIKSQSGASMECLRVESSEHKSDDREICVNATTNDLSSDSSTTPGRVTLKQFSNFTDFEGYRYPRKLDLFLDKVHALSVDVTNLSEEPLDSRLLIPPKDAIARRECADGKPPLNLTGYHPHFPSVPNSGQTELLVTIGADSTVQEVHVVKSAGKEFDGAVIAAVEAAHYRPAMCGAEPVTSDIQIVVSFHGSNP